jgi:hypothetical protein
MNRLSNEITQHKTQKTKDSQNLNLKETEIKKLGIKVADLTEKNKDLAMKIEQMRQLTSQKVAQKS